MKQIFQIAFRNLWQHKAKSLIMIVLIAVGTAILLAGNSIFYTSKLYLKGAFIDSFTGDVMLTGIMRKKNYMPTIFGAYTRGAQLNFGENLMPYLPQKDIIEAKIRSMPQVKTYTKSASGFALLSYDNIPEGWEPDAKVRRSIPYMSILGVDSSDYWKTFDSIEILEGSIPADSGKPFILIDATNIPKKFENYYKKPLKIGDKILLKSISIGTGLTLKTVEVSLAGFFREKKADGVIPEFGYLDISSLRSLMGMTVGANVAVQIPNTVDLSLAEKSEEDLFSDDFDLSVHEAALDNFNMAEIDSVLGDTAVRNKLNMPDEDAWHHITIKLNNSADTGAVIQELTTWFAQNNIEALALDWVAAARQHTDATFIFQQAFNIILVIFSVVLFLVIMNALVVSVIERTGEIGTMRAIGAGKGFIRALFLSETFFLSLIGVAAGTMLASLVIAILNSFNIAITNETLMQLLGKNFKVSIDIASGFLSFGMVLAAGFAASWYPTWLALRVSPLKAMQTN